MVPRKIVGIQNFLAVMTLISSEAPTTYVFMGKCGKLSLNEPVHDKTNKMTCAPSKDSDQPGHKPSLISLRYALNG